LSVFARRDTYRGQTDRHTDGIINSSMMSVWPGRECSRCKAQTSYNRCSIYRMAATNLYLPDTPRE